MPERKRLSTEGQSIHKRKSHAEKKARHTPTEGSTGDVTNLQYKLGNRALQRLIAQRSANTPTELNDETTTRINRERSGGQPLDQSTQKQVGPALGADFSGVRVHTNPEADTLNQDLNARAFTTGQDIFFREGEYQPQSSSGKELIAHELTHVVQQSSGAVGGGGGKMTVNAPGDRFEQEADASARQAVQAGGAAQVQREAPKEDEEELQTKPLQRAAAEEEEETAQTKALQRADAEEEEETAQTKALQRANAEEEEETAQTKALQRAAAEEDEETAQTKALQRAGADEKEEELQTKALQRAEMPEEEDEQMAQKQEMPEEEEEGKA